MHANRTRLDQLLVERGIAASGAKAQAMILAGEVSVAGEIADKPGKKYPVTIEVNIKQKQLFVSRGGIKLSGVLDALHIDVNGLTVLDVGSSTGGFTDCLLQRGAVKVFCVDVGKGLLDWKLRNDTRIVVMEGVNARYLDQDTITDKIDLIVIDTSFISIKKILPAVIPLLKPNGVLLPMLKPQFEVGKDKVPKGGVVKDPTLHQHVLRDVAEFIYNSSFSILNIEPSPITGPKGNREFFVHAVYTPPSLGFDSIHPMIKRAVYE